MSERAAAERSIGCVLVHVALGDEERRDPSLLSRLVDGIGFIARAFNAEARWEADQTLLFIGADRLSDIGERTISLAREIWTRIVLDLDRPVKIAADILNVGEGDARAEPALRIGSGAPPGAVIVGERLALLSRPASRSLLRPCVVEGRPLYSLFSGNEPGGSSSRADLLSLWERMERAHQRPEISVLRYVGLRLGRKTPPVLALHDVFVEPDARVIHGAPERHPVRGARRNSRARPMEARAKQSDSQPISRLLAEHRRLILLGEPGSGKTTLLRWLALESASGRLPDLLGRAEPTLPVLLHAGQFASMVSGAEYSPAQAFAHYCADILEAQESTLAAFFSACLDEGRLLVLLDGLDEVRSEERVALDRWWVNFSLRYPRSRWVITSRFVGYTGFRLPPSQKADPKDCDGSNDSEETLFPVALAHVQPFSVEARERFVRGFARAYVAWEHAAPGGGAPPDPRPLDEIAAREAGDLLEALSGSERLAALGSNPFMLSSLALIHRAEGRLPRHRAQAYEIMARALCETWEHARRLVAQTAEAPALEYEEEALPVLGDLSLEMHKSYPSGVAPAAFIEEKIAASLMKRRGEARDKAFASAREFLQRASQEAPILAERGQGQWGFAHLTFQEFFLVAGLHADERFEEVGLEHLIESRWEEILRLGVGYMAHVQKRPRAVARFIEVALAWRAPEPWTEAVSITGKPIAMAALFAAEAGDTLPAELSERIAKQFLRWIVRLGPWELLDDCREIWLRQMALMEDWAARLSALFYGAIQKAKTRRRREVIAMAADALRVPWTVEQVRAVLPDSVEAAVYYLGKILNRVASINDLEDLSRDPRTGARTALAWALLRRSDTGTQHLLLQLLGDKAWEVRVWAVDAASDRGEVSHEFHMPMLDAMMTVPVRRRWRAYRYFSIAEVSTSVLSTLIAYVRTEEHPDALEWALGTLSAANHPDALENALSLAVERWGSFALDEVLDDFVRAIIEKKRWSLLEAGIQSQNPSERTLFALLVATIVSTRRKKDVPPHVTALVGQALQLTRDPDPDVRRYLFRSLDPRRGKAIRQALISGCQDMSPEVRRSVYLSLAKAVSISTVPVLRAGLSDPDPFVREKSLAVVPYLSASERAAALRAALNDVEAHVREALARQLKNFEYYMPSAIAKLAADPSARVREALVWRLVERNPGTCIPVLRRLVKDDSACVRDSAAYALSKASDGALPILARAVCRSPELALNLWDFLEARKWKVTPISRRASKRSRRKS